MLFYLLIVCVRVGVWQKKGHWAWGSDTPRFRTHKPVGGLGWVTSCLKPQSPHLQNGNGNDMNLWGLLWRLSKHKVRRRLSAPGIAVNIPVLLLSAEPVTCRWDAGSLMSHLLLCRDLLSSCNAPDTFLGEGATANKISKSSALVEPSVLEILLVLSVRGLRKGRKKKTWA